MIRFLMKNVLFRGGSALIVCAYRHMYGVWYTLEIESTRRAIKLN